jgi:hypothetical protein
VTTAWYPTKTRLKFLQAVKDGFIVDDPRDGHTYWAEPLFDPFRVDARTREAEQAGWIVLDEVVGIDWRLTSAGQAVLDAANGGTQ